MWRAYHWIAALLLAATPTRVVAAPPSSAASSETNVETASDDVVPEPPRHIHVHGDVPRHEAVSTSDFDIEPGKLSLVPRGSAEKMMTLAPGVFMVNEGGEGHPSAMFLRGFDAGAGQDIEMKVAGVPINEVSNPHNHGFADTLFIIPELVNRLRVKEGPFDPRQGDFAVAGSAEYDIAMERRGVVASGSYGRFDTGRALLMWGPEQAESGTFVAIDTKAGDGFGTNRAHRSVRAMAGFAFDLRHGFELSLLGAAYATQFRSAGVVRQDDFDARRIPGCAGNRDAQLFCSYDRNQGGGITRAMATAKLARDRGHDRLEQLIWIAGRTMRIREDFTGFAEDPRGDGLEERYDGVTAGARGLWGVRKQWRARPQEIELGYGLRYDDAGSNSRRLRADNGQAYALVFDNSLRVLDVSLYAASTLRPLERLDIDLGLRMDTYWFGRTNHLPNDVAANAFGIALGPRASTGVTLASWPRAGKSKPGSRGGWGVLQWMSAYGMGSRSSDVTAVQDGKRLPLTRVQSFETGLRMHGHGLGGSVELDARALAFYTHVDRELVFDEDVGRSVSVGESNRFGALAVVRAQVEDWLDLQTSVAWSEAYLPPANAGAFDWSAGTRVPYVPRLVVRGDAALFHDFWIAGQPFDYSIALGLSHVGRRPLENDTFGTRITLVDLGARVRWRWVELGLDIQNLFNARYHQYELYFASDFHAGMQSSQDPMLHFIAGQPLMAMGTLTLYFEPGERRRLHERRAARGIDARGRTLTLPGRSG